MMRPKRAISAALVALLVLGGLGSAEGLVLCLAADGHAKIGFAREECCSDFFSARGQTTAPQGEQLKGSASGSSHCGSCVDIPLGIGSRTKQQNLILQDSDPSTKLPVALASGFSFSPVECVARQCSPTAQRLGDDMLASLRAVVLLI